MLKSTAVLTVMVWGAVTQAAPRTREAREATDAATAQSFLAARPELAAGMELRLERTRAPGVVRFRRHHLGVPVVGSGAVAVRVGPGGGIAWSSADRAAVPADLAVTPGISAAGAVGIASQGVLSDPAGARLVVWAPPRRPARLAWEVRLPPSLSELTQWRVYVDAQRGAILGRQNDLRTAKLAKAYTRGSPLVGGVDEVTLDLPDGATRLENADFITFNCIDRLDCPLHTQGMDLRFCSYEVKAKADAAGNFLFARPSDDLATEDEFAEVQMFFHATRVLKMFRGLGLVNLPGVPMVLYANHRQPENFLCSAHDTLRLYNNAFYARSNAFWPPRDALVFGQGTEVDFSYEGNVVYHELTHAVQEELYGSGYEDYFLDEFGRNGDGTAMKESTADYFAAATSGNPLIGEYALAPFGAQRDLAVAKHCPEYLDGEQHDDSEPFSSGLWSARTALPEGQRTTFDKAVFNALAAFGDTESFDSARAKIVNETRTLLGATAADTVAARFAAHGLDGCSDRLGDLAVDEKWRALYIFGSADSRTPASLQFRVTLDAPVDLLVVKYDDSSPALPPAGSVRLLVKKGSESIRWNPETLTNDATEVPVSLTGNHASIVVGPFPAGPVVLQFVLGQGVDFLLLTGLRFHGQMAASTPDAGPAMGSGDGGGCEVGGRGRAGVAAWLLLLFALARAGRRRSTARRPAR